MTVENALQLRHSVRAFTSEQPSAALVRKLLELSASSASGGNLQPWRAIAVTGEPLQQVIAAANASPAEETAANASYPPNLWEPYRTRRYQNGEEMYQSIGIGREDKAERLAQVAKNFTFFGAPVGVFVIVDQRMLPAQWLDLGIYLQSFMLLAVENGLATCAQGFWRRYQTPLKQVLGLAETDMIAFGISLGFEDTAVPINQWRSSRAPVDEWLDLRGFE